MTIHIMFICHTACTDKVMFFFTSPFIDLKSDVTDQDIFYCISPFTDQKSDMTDKVLYLTVQGSEV